MALAKYKEVCTDRELAAAKPKDGKVIIKGVGGMSMRIGTTGKKTFAVYVQKGQKRANLTVGTYPEMGLKEAITEARRLKEQFKGGEIEASPKAALLDSFEASCEGYYNLHKKDWSDAHSKDVYGIIKELCFGRLNSVGLGLAHIKTPKLTKADVLPIIEAINERGSGHAVRDTMLYLRLILEFYNAKQTDLSKRVSIEHLDLNAIRRSLRKLPRVEHHPALPIEELPQFYADVFKRSKSIPRAKMALMLMALTGLRTNNLTSIKLSYIDLKKKEILIPGKEMKGGDDFWLPLSKQAIQIIQTQIKENDLYVAKGSQKSVYLFPGHRDRSKPMSNQTVLELIHDIGYKGRQSGHGFRTNLSSWASSQLVKSPKWTKDAIETALDHRERGDVASAYDWRYEFKEERIALFNAWGEELDKIVSKGMMLD